jgi:hypothetical protein
MDINATLVDLIINDLKSRKGLSQVWESLDEDQQNEIRKCWEELVQEPKPLCGYPTYPPVTKKAQPSLPENAKAIQFTDEMKDRVFNSLKGNVHAGFEHGEPILKVTTVDGKVAVAHLGDWIVQDTVPGTYHIVNDPDSHAEHMKHEQQ